MSTEQAGSVVIQVSATDFERLCENSGQWAGWTPPAGRFESIDTAGNPFPSARQWQCAYWVGDNWTTVIFARAFLAARGFDYEVVYDTAEHPNGRLYGYVILTDYEQQ